MNKPPRTAARRRLDRQFDVMERKWPAAAGPLHFLRRRRWRMLRIPLALALIGGGFLAILPFFGLWMIPLGLALLAQDVPALEGPVANAIVRLRRRMRRGRSG